MSAKNNVNETPKYAIAYFGAFFSKSIFVLVGIDWKREYMENVYDWVEGFYENDPEWNSLLRKEYADGFLRNQAWQGKSEEELFAIWNRLVMLCLYLGNTTLMLGDMSAEDFIDCVAWCGRNVSEFKPEYTHTEAFLTTCIDLFAYLSQQNAITSASAPAEAADILLAGGVMNIINSQGEFDELSKKRNNNASADLPTKIYLSIGDRIEEIYDTAESFFRVEGFLSDFQKATALFKTVYRDFSVNKEHQGQGALEAFWDYFLFDYRLQKSNERPIDYFYREVCVAGQQHYNEDFAKRNSDVITELLAVHLAVFFEEDMKEDLSVCRDLLTGEVYYLHLPITEPEDKKDKIFIGHVFYNNSMLLDNIFCVSADAVERKFLRLAFEKCFNWVKVQTREADWIWFINRFPMVIRCLVLICTGGNDYKLPRLLSVRSETLPEATPIEACYAKVIETALLEHYFSITDVEIVCRLLADYFVCIGESREHSVSEYVAGAIFTFLETNRVYSFTNACNYDFCHVGMMTMLSITDKIETKLKIPVFDSRYINEEGFLVMLLGNNGKEIL